MAQEPRITAYVSRDEKMVESFQAGRDIYASIASIAFNVPYEKCLEFHPETHEYQADGKARRGEAKTIVLGEPNGFKSWPKANAPLVETCKTKTARCKYCELYYSQVYSVHKVA